MGSHGFCLELSLRPGTQHSAKHTGDNLRECDPGGAARCGTGTAGAVTWSHPRPGKRVALWETEVSIEGGDRPVRHSAKRRRIKTVTQELIYRAGRLIEHGRQLILGLGANDRSAQVFMRMNAHLGSSGIGVT